MEVEKDGDGVPGEYYCSVTVPGKGIFYYSVTRNASGIECSLMHHLLIHLNNGDLNE